MKLTVMKLAALTGLALALIGCESRFERSIKQQCASLGQSKQQCGCYYSAMEERFGEAKLKQFNRSSAGTFADVDAYSDEVSQRCFSRKK